MFSYCKLKPSQKMCAFHGFYKSKEYCGIAKGENKISSMNKCPYVKKKKITTLTNYLKHLEKQ
tara:strand:+ start:349 stop:537 length:189 start_codon:yes stop_codon:yes gene_type:complete